jgi:signal transduction histidine kinase
MSTERRLLEVLETITTIAHKKKYSFEKKLNALLTAITEYMQVQKSSIMLLKNGKTLAVVASTNPELIGVCQGLEVDSPSSWVVRSKKSLYVDRTSECSCAIKRYSHYKGDAFFLVPLISNTRVIGVISVTEKIGIDIFAQEERDVLLQIMGQVIIALENHRFADTLKKKKRVLQQKNKELQKLEKLRTDLFNMLIHDLKGPLSEIVANLDILAYTLKDENLTFVEAAQSGCNTLYSMVSNLLDISRLEEKQLPLLYEPIDPRELVREALAGLLVSVQSRGVQFDEQYPQAGAFDVPADRALLIRVFQNLLTNAIQYSPPGGEICVGYVLADNKTIRFFVQDSGPGIPVESREAIFDKFKQLDKKADGRVYTTGLGLAFCKLAIEAHGGTIGVESSGGTGSRFVFTLPLAKKK